MADDTLFSQFFLLFCSRFFHLPPSFFLQPCPSHFSFHAHSSSASCPSIHRNIPLHSYSVPPCPDKHSTRSLKLISDQISSDFHCISAHLPFISHHPHIHITRLDREQPSEKRNTRDIPPLLPFIVMAPPPTSPSFVQSSFVHPPSPSRARFQSSSPSPTSPTYQHHQYQHSQPPQHQHNRYPDHTHNPLPPPTALSNHNVTIPRRGSSSNIYQNAPLQSPVGSSHSSNSNNHTYSYNNNSNPFTSPSTGLNHPLDGRPQQPRLDFDLEKDLDLGLSPPHPTFAGQNRGRTPSPAPSSSSTLHANPAQQRIASNNGNSHDNNSYPQPSFSRPESVHSFSNLSTHSNEPLNPPRILNKKMSAGTVSSSNSTRVGGSPLHNKYNMNKSNSRGAKFSNHLDLPEDKSRAYRPQGHGRNPAHGPAPGMDDIDLDDDEDEKPRKSAMKPGAGTAVIAGDIAPKPRKTIMSRLKRVSSVKLHMARNIKMGGTGKMARFSNERLYLHWIRFGLLQSSIAVTLLSFGDETASYVGVVALVLSLLTLTYATTLYHKRHLWMVTKRQDVAYFARTVPTLIALALLLLYFANFVINLKIGPTAVRPPWVQYDVKFGV